MNGLVVQEILSMMATQLAPLRVASWIRLCRSLGTLKDLVRQIPADEYLERNFGQASMPTHMLVNLTKNVTQFKELL